jgi:2-C-methyl-D-erythritol 2,4-cyclodiphosphate synthase
VKGSARRIGIGWDVHRLEAGRKLVLGGVLIPHDRGLVGHSDGALQRAIDDVQAPVSGAVSQRRKLHALPASLGVGAPFQLST